MCAVQRLEEQERVLEEYEQREKQLRDVNSQQEGKIESLRQDLNVRNGSIPKLFVESASF